MQRQTSTNELLHKNSLIVKSMSDLEFLAQNINLLKNKEITLNGLSINIQMVPLIMQIVSKGKIKKMIYDTCIIPNEPEDIFYIFLPHSNGIDLTVKNCNITPIQASDILDYLDILSNIEIDFSNNQINGPDLDDFLNKVKQLVNTGAPLFHSLNLKGNNIPQSKILTFQDSSITVIFDWKI